MAKQQTSDSTLVMIKIARGFTYFVYAYALIAITFLSIGTVLLLFGANTESGFVEFVYKGALHFLTPFREIFPGTSVGDSGYFSTSAVFAIIMYGFFAMLLHSLISYITLKMVQHEKQLEELQK